MIVQRLSFRAATGKLHVIAVWRCLVKRGAKICRWNVHVDRKTGVESMTIDVVGSDPLHTDELAAMLGETPMELTIKVFHMAVVANPDVAQVREKQRVVEATGSQAITRPRPKLTSVTDITHHVARSRQD
ncbi:hypothetical protein DID96_19685 [Burkholderia sp. Bp8963]|uniref:hypothetical protein n=1 Tax=Burkholderia sp. Bp8963 TaxID=2184547 RepID=UPI000F59BC18|nr:hypothetical protein [Burkholderia sp. Bp8963]RQS68433.1 hypothetical protein DID96_19685 [Burkholderia sp. Bp8963]